MDFRKKYALGHLAVFLLIFLVFRIILYISYNDYFASVSFGSFLLACFDGIRFDISMILTFMGLILFLMNIPILKKKWLKLLTVILSFEYLALLMLLIGDAIYFAEVKRHLGDELILVVNDIGFLVSVSIKNYWYFLLILAIGFAGFIKFQFMIINKYFIYKKTKIIREIFLQVLLVLIVILGIRGTFNLVPIQIIDAFEKGSAEYGNLVLNGLFSSYHFSSNVNEISHDFYSEQDAYQSAIQNIIENDEVAVNSDYPFLRYRKNFYFDSLNLQQKPNVVVFLLESWTPEYIDVLSGKNYGVTPVFDSLARQGMLFNNFYANGDRSILGITATLLGISQSIGLPYLEGGLGLLDLFRIGNVFNENDYYTIFLQTSLRGSYKMDAIAGNLGFKNYYGKQDAPKKYNYMSDEEPYFGWDYEPLMLLEEKISSQNKHFFGFLFTGTTHESYVLADNKFLKYKPHEPKGRNGYLNALAYSDWAIGEFFKKASKEKWFDNTIFIFTADHNSRFVDNNVEAQMRIPLLIYAPKLIKPQINNTLGSQADIPATIIDLVGFKNYYSGIGKSLLRDYNNRLVIFRQGHLIGIKTNDGFLRHDLKHRVDYRINEKLDKNKTLDILEKKLLSIEQTLFSLFKKNKFYSK